MNLTRCAGCNISAPTKKFTIHVILKWLSIKINFKHKKISYRVDVFITDNILKREYLHCMQRNNPKPRLYLCAYSLHLAWNNLHFKTKLYFQPIWKENNPLTLLVLRGAFTPFPKIFGKKRANFRVMITLL